MKHLFCDNTNLINTDKKKVQIEAFLQLLIEKYQSKTQIVYSLEPASYRFENNSINISLIELKTESLEELLWTVAHEYRHHLQFKGKVNSAFQEHYLIHFKKLKQCKDSIKRNSYSLALIPISILLLKDFPIILLLMNLPILATFLFFVNSPGIDLYLWMHDKKNLDFSKKLEKDADHFANKEVGTGYLVWGKYSSDPDFDSEKTHHPSHKERFIDSLQFRINPQIYDFIK